MRDDEQGDQDGEAAAGPPAAQDVWVPVDSLPLEVIQEIAEKGLVISHVR